MTLFNDSVVDPVDDKTPEQIFAELVGEGKKFRTPEELAKGKYESDRFIPQLQKELQELREELNKRLTIEEMMTKIADSQKAETSTPPAIEPKKPDVVDNKTETLDVSKLISTELEKRERAREADANRDKVRKALIDAYGGTYLVELNKRAAELGLSKTDADALAAANPQVFLNAFGVKSDPASAGSPTRVAVVPPVNNSGNKNYAYYQKLRAENPRVYHDSKTQMEMFENAKKLGEDFYN